ncbi:MAG: hypothetical protein ABGW50_01655 [Thermococcus sp.]
MSGKLPPYYPFLQAIFHRTSTTVVKFDDPDGKVYKELRKGSDLKVVKNSYRARLIEEREVEGNVLLIEGAQFMWTCLNSPTSCSPPFDGSNTYIGVGDGTTAEDPTQTGLLGTNVYYKLVDTGYPQISQNIFTARATFGPTEANFSWNEWTIANGNSNTAVNLNRKVEALGTKAAGSTWVLQVSIQLT